MPLVLSPMDSAIGAVPLTAEGEYGYDSVRNVMRFRDSIRERAISSIGYAPYAYPVGDGPAALKTTAQALAVTGGAMAVPVEVPSHMLLQSVVFWNTDIATARGPVEFALFEGQEGNASLLNRVAAGSLAAWTPTVASSRLIPVTGAPVYLGPGVYWLVLKNNNASVTMGLGSTAAGTMAGTVGQTKTLGTAALGLTLDMVLATWVKFAWVPGVRLNGRVFGQAVGF